MYEEAVSIVYLACKIKSWSMNIGCPRQHLLVKTYQYRCASCAHVMIVQQPRGHCCLGSCAHVMIVQQPKGHCCLGSCAHVMIVQQPRGHCCLGSCAHCAAAQRPLLSWVMCTCYDCAAVQRPLLSWVMGSHFGSLFHLPICCDPVSCLYTKFSVYSEYITQLS